MKRIIATHCNGETKIFDNIEDQNINYDYVNNTLNIKYENNEVDISLANVLVEIENN
jgi:hypothetical protein